MFELGLAVPGHNHGKAGKKKILYGPINLPLVCQIILAKKHMILSVTFIIIWPRALYPLSSVSIFPPDVNVSAVCEINSETFWTFACSRAVICLCIKT